MTKSSKLRHNLDMLIGLSERLAVLAAEDPKAFSSRYVSVMDKVIKEEKPLTRKMTQADTILFLLRKGHTLTNKSLIVNHKIASPTRRISDLRERGYDIKVSWKTCPVDGSQYAEYSLPQVDLETA